VSPSRLPRALAAPGLRRHRECRSNRSRQRGLRGRQSERLADSPPIVVADHTCFPRRRRTRTFGESRCAHVPVPNGQNGREMARSLRRRTGRRRLPTSTHRSRDRRMTSASLHDPARSSPRHAVRSDHRNVARGKNPQREAGLRPASPAPSHPGGRQALDTRRPHRSSPCWHDPKPVLRADVRAPPSYGRATSDGTSPGTPALF
jgi:hypothetical protein